MNRPGLINKIKIKMDEYTPEGVSLPFDDYIGPLLDEAVMEVLEKSPLHLLTPTPIPLEVPPADPPETPPVTPTSLVLYSGDKSYIPVPTDYVKLYEIRYPLWKRSVRKAFAVESPQYKLQENQYLTGGYGRPFVAILQTSVNEGTVGRYFECSKVVDPGSGTITPIALYVKRAQVEDLNENLTDALSWLAASKLLLTMGYGDKAAVTADQAMQALMILGNS